MFKRLFGGKAPAPSASNSSTGSTPATAPGPAWSAPQTPYRSYYNVHIYDVPHERVVARLQATYLRSAQSGAAAVVLAEENRWCTAYVEPVLARRVGFNKLASEIAHDLDTWVIGYRIDAGEGMDVHYFQASAHLDQLALSEDDLAFEPMTASLFSSLTDASHLIPRRPDQHPLDFHFALLETLGIRNAALTWEDALTQHQAGAFLASWLLPVEG